MEVLETAALCVENACILRASVVYAYAPPEGPAGHGRFSPIWFSLLPVLPRLSLPSCSLLRTYSMEEIMNSFTS